MWCDNFDMDLYKVLPAAETYIKPLAEIKLKTHGALTDGQLNHPSVWNGYEGSLAFFGFNTPSKPEGYWTNQPVIDCTFEEVMRDAWPHQYFVLIEGKPIWNTLTLWPQFQDIMSYIRGWDKESPRDINKAVIICLESICLATKRLRDII